MEFGVFWFRFRNFWCVFVWLNMDDNTELEEGEACYYKDDDDDNIDLDSLSYIVRVFFTFEFALVSGFYDDDDDDDDDYDEYNFDRCIVIDHGLSMYQCIWFMEGL